MIGIGLTVIGLTVIGLIVIGLTVIVIGLWRGGCTHGILYRLNIEQVLSRVNIVIQCQTCLLSLG